MAHKSRTTAEHSSKAHSMLKSAGYASGGGIPTPKPRPGYGKEGMNNIEADNYDVLRHSNKNFSEEESRYMATNPSGRISPQPNSLDYSKGVHKVPVTADTPPPYPQRYTDLDAQEEADNQHRYGKGNQ